MHTDKKILPYQGKVRVVFMIQRISIDPTAEHVYLVGSVPTLGDWDCLQAKQTGYSGLNSWIVEAFFEPHSVVDFKLCLLRQMSRNQLGSGDVSPTLVHREEGWFRRLHLTDVPLCVHVTYNCRAVKVVESRSTLTVDGRPWRPVQGNADIRINKKDAVELQNTTSKTAMNKVPAYQIEIVPDDNTFGEILIDTRFLRSWDHLEPAEAACEPRKRGEGKKEIKKRWKKKRKATLRKVVKKYGGVEENQSGVVKEGDKKPPTEKNIDNEVAKDASAEITKQKTNCTGSPGWERAVKMGLGFGAAVAMYLLFKQK